MYREGRIFEGIICSIRIGNTLNSTKVSVLSTCCWQMGINEKSSHKIVASSMNNAEVAENLGFLVFVVALCASDAR